MKLTSRTEKLRNFTTSKVIGKVLAFILVIGILVSFGPVANAATFSDVPSSHWAYSAVNYVSTNKYMLGITSTLFDPDGTLTKGQIVTVLYRVAGELDVTNYQQPYSDVAQGRFYYDPVRWAYSRSLSQVIQTSSTIFSPDSTISRVKIAELIWKFAQAKGWANSIVPSVTLPYADIANLTTTQKNALKWCYSNSIMVGVSGALFSPNTTITRAQMAKLIYNFDGYVTKNKAFCVGTNYNDSDKIDTSIDATTARDNYKKMGYEVTCVTVPTVDIMRDKHSIKSKIIFFSGHGNSSCITFNYMQSNSKHKTGVYYRDNYNSSTGYNYVGIEGNMDFVNLAVFAACKTAEGTNNIAKRARDYGAKVSIGWTQSVYSGSHTNWLERFNSWLAAGTTVTQAINYANSFTYLPGSGVKDLVVYYESQSYIYTPLILSSNPVMSAFHNTFEDPQAPKNMIEAFQINTNIGDTGISAEAEVAAMIQKLDDTFHIEDYTIYTYKNSDEITTIDFIRVIGGFETNSGFTAIINCDKLVSLYDNTKDISEDEKAGLSELSESLGISSQLESERAITDQNAKAEEIQNESEELTEALRFALEQTQSSSQKEAAQQRYHYYYDIESGSACILVYTEYYFDGTDAMGVDMYIYNLVD